MKTHPTHHRSSFARVACIVGALFAAGLSAFAQAPVKLTHGDRSFVEKAAKAGSEEIAISEVALSRSQNPQVQQLARMIVADHKDASMELSSLATAKGVTLPAKELAPAKWSKKDGKEFDEDYVEKMVDAHEDAVKLFAKQATDGKDVDVTAFARATLPKLQHHLEQAKDLKKALK